MLVDFIKVGPIATNCYFLCDEATKECAIIDPGAMAPKILKKLEELGMKCTKILLTHGHYDHIMALREIHDATGAPVCIHTNDAHMILEDYVLNMRAVAARGYRQATADIVLNDGDDVKVGNLTVHVVNTPGHTRGSCLFLCEDVMFAGDTIFRGDCGRWDLDGGSQEEMIKSLQKIAAFDVNYKILPGHAGATTLNEERETNVNVIYALKQAN